MPGLSYKKDTSSPLMQRALAIVTEVNDTWCGFGSGIIIGQRLALTARHVVVNAWRQNERRFPLPFDDHLVRGTDAEFDGWDIKAKELKIYAVNYCRKQSRFLTWNIKTVWSDSFTDIVVMRLEPHSDGCDNYDWMSLGMTARLPDINSPVHAFGFHSPKVEIFARTPEHLALAMQNDPTFSVGSVLEVCESTESARSVGRLFPGMRTDLPVRDSMSGGPVFDAKGQLCGIISSSMHTEEDSNTYVAGLWPLVCLGLDGIGMTPAKDPTRGIGRFKDLLEFGILHMADWRQVKCAKDSIGDISIRGFNGKSQIAKRARF